MRSIRRRLTLRLVLATSLLGACGVLAAYVYLRSELRHQFDDHLLSHARTIASLAHAEDEHSPVEFELTSERSPTGQHVANQLGLFQIWTHNGDVLVKAKSLGKTDLPRPAGTAAATGGGRNSHYFDLTLPDGQPGRGVMYVVSPWVENSKATSSGVPPITLVFATDLHDLHDTLRVAMIGFLVIFSALALATLLTVVSTVRRALRPLKEIGSAVERVDPATLGERFDVAALPVELRSVAQKLNELLSRLDDAFRRERRFTANVAHELRTPIAELRSLAEVALHWPPADPDASAASYRDVLAVARQMEAVVSALLAIARCQAGHEPLAFKPVVLDEVIADAWRPFAATARERRLTVDLSATTAQADCDQTVLTVMLRNLFANAVAYAPAGGRVWCEFETRGDRCAVSVLNTNDSLTDKDLPLLTEPFWRKDTARNATGEHAGLGLSLVAAYANLLRATFTTSLRGPGTFVATLELPLCRGTEPPARSPARDEQASDVAKLAPANMIAP
jgi:two-component system sensor histidine kinase QseC